MNLEKIYHDVDGNECTILQLIRRDNAWAANVIQSYEASAERNTHTITQLQTELADHDSRIRELEAVQAELIETLTEWRCGFAIERECHAMEACYRFALVYKKTYDARITKTNELLTRLSKDDE